MGASVSGLSEAEDGEWDSGVPELSEVELEIENAVREYGDETGSFLTRVSGSHGWRVFEWSDGAVHRYEWTHHLLDLRCAHCKSPNNDFYMVTDEVWESSDLDGWACFRCLEKAIGRRLWPDDFKPGLPANDGDHHEPELRSRMGL